ncbi:MAG: PilZ domain-containing protein [Candidatus Scalinduaceae bacterium]
MVTQRRVYPRVDVNITLSQLGNAVNISEGGMCVIVDNPIPVGHMINLDLFLPNSSVDDVKEPLDQVKLEGIVVWSKHSELLDKHEVGIKFTDQHLYNREKVKTFIEKYT